MSNLTNTAKVIAGAGKGGNNTGEWRKAGEGKGDMFISTTGEVTYIDIDPKPSPDYLAGGNRPPYQSEGRPNPYENTGITLMPNQSQPIKKSFNWMWLLLIPVFYGIYKLLKPSSNAKSKKR